MTEKQTKKQIWEERRLSMEELQRKSNAKQMPIMEKAYKNAAGLAGFAGACIQIGDDAAFFKFRATAGSDWTCAEANALISASLPHCDVMLENAWNLSQKLIAEAKEKQADMLVSNLRNMGKDFQ